MQFSAVGGVLVPHVAPLSKLYSILNPGTAAGAVTTIGPQPLFTAGAGGIAGNITTLTVLLVPHEPGPVAPAVVLPHAAVKIYCACTVWQPGATGIVGEAEYAPPSMLY